jgi:hypothetical protein
MDGREEDGREEDESPDPERCSKVTTDVGVPIERRGSSFGGGDSLREGIRERFSFREEGVEGGDKSTSFVSLNLPFERPLLERLERKFMAQQVRKDAKRNKRTGSGHGQP